MDPIETPEYVEPYALIRAIENQDDAKAASLARYDVASFIRIPSSVRASALDRAARVGLYETVKVALEAGYHPNDTDIFPQPLLGLRNWYSKPKFLALALQYGANPDTLATPDILLGDTSIPIARHLVERMLRPQFSLTQDQFRDARECLLLLLMAGAKTIDGPLDDAGRPKRSAAWMIAWILTSNSELKNSLGSLIPALKQGGADLDTPCKSDSRGSTHPLIAAIRNKNQAVAEALIAAGVRIDDKHLSCGKRNQMNVLFREVDENFGAQNSAWVRHAIMRRTLAESELVTPVSAPCALDSKPAAQGDRRRRMAV